MDGWKNFSSMSANKRDVLKTTTIKIELNEQTHTQKNKKTTQALK